MRILWLCNTLIEEIATELNLFFPKPESWISAVHKDIIVDENIELYYLFPINGEGIKLKKNNVTYLSYPQKKPDLFEEKQVDVFKRILEEAHPDVIHIFGTELPHTYAMMLATKETATTHKTIISIQGLISRCLSLAFLPNSVINGFTFRDLLKFENIYLLNRKFKKRALYEVEALKIAENVIGRTDWDKACVDYVNPNINYWFCNETLRPAFYEDVWNYEKCEKHSVFVSQCNYHIKGFHLILENFRNILRDYPDAHLYTTGKNPLQLTFGEKIRQTNYNRYLGKLIKEYNLQDCVTFLGYLSEKEMSNRMVKSNVFLSCSVIENSPNSLGEAMMLGVPCVSSDVGGVKNMLTHNEEGYIYPADEPYMAAYYIKKIFGDKEIGAKFSVNARKKARITHDVKNNFNKMLKIYSELADRGNQNG